MWISLIFLFPSYVIAASCCGSGASAAGIMTSDTSWTFRTSYSDVTLTADSNSGSRTNYRNESQVETIRTTNFSFRKLFGQLWQAGIDVPMVEKVRKLGGTWQSQAGSGDLRATVAYEFLPEFTRGKLPRGFGYLSLSLPTAPSLFTTNRSDLLDTRGSGHYHLIVGSLFSKRFEKFSLGLQPQLSYRFGREFSADNFTGESITTEGSLDHLIGIFASTDITSNFSAVISANRNYMDKKSISTFIGNGQKSLVHDLAMGINYAVDDKSDVTVIYTDQFILGESYNHTLGRSLGVSYLVKKNL